MHTVSILDFPLIGLRLEAPFGEADVLSLDKRMRELLSGCDGAVFALICAGSACCRQRRPMPC